MKKLKYSFIIISIIFFSVILMIALLVGSNQLTKAYALAVSTSRYVDGTSGNDFGNCANPSSPCKTLSFAVNKAQPGDTLNLANTITESGQILLNKNLIIQQWEGKEQAILKANYDTGDSGTSRCWICLQNNAQVTLQGLHFEGTGHDVMEAIRVSSGTTLTMQETNFQNFAYTDLYGDGLGLTRGSAVYVEGGTLKVSESEFSGFGRAAILACGGTVQVTKSRFKGDGNTDDSVVNYGLVGGNGAQLQVGQSWIEKMKGTTAYPSAGLALVKGAYFCPSLAFSTAVVTSTHILSSTVGLLIGEGLGDNSTVTAHSNRIYGNGKGVKEATDATPNLEYNWWGCNAGPNDTAAKCDSVEGTLDYTPWLTLTLNLSPNSVYLGETFQATGQIKSGQHAVPNGAQMKFGGEGITFSPAVTETLGGEAKTTGTVGGGAAPASRVVTATLDNGVATAVLSLKKRSVYLPLILKSVWELIHSDDFNYENPPVPNSESDDWVDILGGLNFYHSYNQGRLLMTANGISKSFLTILKRANLIDSSDKTYAIEVKSIPMQNDYRYGLVLGFQENQGGRNFYSFLIHPLEQKCELRRFSGSAWIETIPCDGKKTAIRTTGENLLRAEFDSQKVDFYVNGEKVFTYNLPASLVGTRVGFITVSGTVIPSIIAFDDFAVYRHR